jgi:hypothetical protein
MILLVIHIAIINILIILRKLVFIETNSPPGEAIPVGGVAYYLSPPTSIFQFMLDPIRSLTYCSFVIFSCAWLSKYWVNGKENFGIHSTYGSDHEV